MRKAKTAEEIARTITKTLWNCEPSEDYFYEAVLKHVTAYSNEKLERAAQAHESYLMKGPKCAEEQLANVLLNCAAGEIRALKEQT